MQTNTQPVIPLDQNSQNSDSMSQPVLTRSLPSIVGSVPSSLDNVLVSGIHQSYVSSPANVICTQSRDPMDNNIPQKPSTILNCSQNLCISPKIAPTTKPIPVRAQPSFSTVITSSKNSERYKKKVRPRYKGKYLLKVINVQEVGDIEDKILTFEMTLPMNQMRFSCCLRIGMSSLDVSNSVVKDGQIPGELCKKDILESLVNTVKKICQQMTEDSNSIHLNEDYVFYPCFQNSGLIKVTDYLLSNATSLDTDNIALGVPINFNMSIQANENLFNGCASSVCNENLSFSMGHLSTEISEHLSNDLLENYVVNPILSNNVELVYEDELNSHTIVSAKCQCQANDSTLKVPEYIFSTVKQMVEKLLNLNCKGVIILPQSNDILTRNFRILEIPADHMFVGLPCSDSYYNVIKGQKDKDFIIARDTRNPENVTEKCVYQKPSDGAVLLDSLGEIKYIQKPSLIMPAQMGHGNEKTEIWELPEELTHSKSQSIDCEQIISMLKSLAQTSNNSDESKEELFDSPVLLEGISKLQTKFGDKLDVVENTQIQVERISCQYVSLPNSTDVKQEEAVLTKDTIERNLSRQEFRSRRISNESMDSNITFRTRATSAVPLIYDSNALKSNQISLTSAQKYIVAGVIGNNGNTGTAGSASGQLHQTNHTNLIQNVPHYCNSSQGATSRGMVYQKNVTMSPNFSHILPDQMTTPSGMTTTQVQQIHQKSTGPGTALSFSGQPNQLIPNIHGVLPNKQATSAQLFSAQIPSFVDQNLIQASLVVEVNDPMFPTPPRPISSGNPRQSQHCDPSITQSVISDNGRLQLKTQQANEPPQTQAVLTPNISLQTPLMHKMALSAANLSSEAAMVNQAHECHHASRVDNTPKVEETIGRFVIKPITDSKMTN